MRAGHYIVSLSLEPEKVPWAGLAELYFPDMAAHDKFQTLITPDGTEALMDWPNCLTLLGGTEMVGIA